ncbi:centrosomal protein CCDC61-like [Anthonomus grandis grandis]|uniref:centrosomal protein CCDC61-like n=1 Tax=Anthonomus grandis grandis TaxID=2921223 RepID=UPI0021668599|nr:centrosomal protein CCDC61-like [Anthonomus grandis grandis]
MADPNLVTTYSFHGQEYLFKMNVLNSNLEILITDKNTGEEWQCAYDATYIENLSQKTGNFKQFDVFVAMIKSGLLRTSESVSLDLLTFEDLELLRSRKITKSVGVANNNRRYLILTYIVEFDKIRYPLPLEYCGPPDPHILQTTIRRLEVELAKTKEELAAKNNNNDAKKMYFLQKRVDELTDENLKLKEEILHLSRPVSGKKSKNVLQLQRAVSNLEKSVVLERHSHHELVEKLREDKLQLLKELERVKCSERSLKSKLNRALSQQCRFNTDEYAKNFAENHTMSNQSLRTMFRRRRTPVRKNYESSLENIERERPRKELLVPKYLRASKSSNKVLSRSSSGSSTNKYMDPEMDVASRPETPVLSASVMPSLLKNKSAYSSGNSSRASSRVSTRKSRSKSRKSIDYKKLEEKIEHLQQMLKNNMRHDVS